MAAMRNDLEPPARRLQPVIADVSGALATTGAALVRMSGSGATCFGLFDSDESAQRAAYTLSAAHPEWYVLAGRTVGRGKSEWPGSMTIALSSPSASPY